ncbi:MAG: extra-cytoplasmic solute receptor BugT [Xanthobacteraceae bacterium]|nr:extra-cytoplasmic solute receptor BugT [Xanthobacteraceae bacterium]
MNLLPSIRAVAGLMCVGAITLSSNFAQAQTYPDKVVRLVVPAGPGGPTDVLARLIADRLTASLKQPVIVDNRGGAGGVIGARSVATASPDGYTLLFGNTATLANIPAVSKSANYDPVKNFTAVAKLTDSYQILVVAPEFPVKSVAELIAYAKANPGKLNYADVGIGNLTHLSGELLKLKAGIDFVPVHYKSGGEAMTALLGNQAQFAIDNVAVVRPLLQDGKLRALAVTSKTRQPDFPDLPTMIEAGVADYVVTSFFGVVAPAGTPLAIVQRLNADILAALKTPETQAVMAKLGAKPANETPEEFGAFIAAELKRWTDIANTAGIKID